MLQLNNATTMAHLLHQPFNQTFVFVLYNGFISVLRIRFKLRGRKVMTGNKNGVVYKSLLLQEISYNLSAVIFDSGNTCEHEYRMSIIIYISSDCMRQIMK